MLPGEMAPRSMLPHQHQNGEDLNLVPFVVSQATCPLTRELMIDPVCCADGNTYERYAIEEWLSASPTSPLTGERLDDLSLRHNSAIRSLARTVQRQLFE